VYAIVKAGGRQEKVSVGETLVVDRLDAAVGAKVNCEVLAEQKGPKIAILRYKNKTGYRRRQGFRSQLTRVKITEINK
jgi:large subunit ribosomal protein L21